MTQTQNRAHYFWDGPCVIYTPCDSFSLATLKNSILTRSVQSANDLRHVQEKIDEISANLVVLDNVFAKTSC